MIAKIGLGIMNYRQTLFVVSHLGGNAKSSVNFICIMARINYF